MEGDVSHTRRRREMETTAVADMQAAGYLLATGHKMLRMEEQGRKKLFVFEQCDAELQAFYRGEVAVNARQLFDCYYHIKNLVFERKSY